MNLSKCLEDLRKKQDKDTISEKDVVVNFGGHVLGPLFGDVTFEKGYQKHLDLAGHSFEVKYIASNTWHGSTELRVKGCNIVGTKVRGS